MRDVLLILLGIDFIAVLAVLLAGAIGMAAPDRDPRVSNRLMRWRVGLQAVAIVLVLLLFAVSQ